MMAICSCQKEALPSVTNMWNPDKCFQYLVSGCSPLQTVQWSSENRLQSEVDFNSNHNEVAFKGDWADSLNVKASEKELLMRVYPMLQMKRAPKPGCSGLSSLREGISQTLCMFTWNGCTHCCGLFYFWLPGFEVLWRHVFQIWFNHLQA